MSLANKLGTMVTYLDGLLPITSYDPLITWSSKITWHTQTISTTTVLIATKLGRMVINLEELLPIMLLDPLFTWSCDIAWQTKAIISPLSRCLSPKNLAGVGLNMRGGPLIKLNDDTNTWSWEFMWQTKNISPLSQCIWPQNIAGCWLTLRGSYSWCYSTLWSLGLVRSPDKLKHISTTTMSGHKTWYDGDLLQAFSTYSVT